MVNDFQFWAIDIFESGRGMKEKSTGVKSNRTNLPGLAYALLLF